MALSVNPLAQDGTWLRCALHAHTTRSDGEQSPEELVNHYEQAGFDVLAITDHWIRTEAAASPPCIGTNCSSAASTATGSRPTTRTTPSSTVVSPGSGPASGNGRRLRS